MDKTVIRTEKLRREFYETVAVDDMDLEVREGDIFGLIGPNGAGKTTTLRMLATSLRPTSGTAHVDGMNILTDEVRIRRTVGFMPDFFSLYNDLKVWELLDCFARAHRIRRRERKQRIDEVIQVADLENKRDAFVRGLSRGMTQRLCFARALIHHPDILLLDEPASGLDPRARLAQRTHLKKLNADGVTILISSHILAELTDFCTSIGIMEKGRLIQAGPVAEIARDVAAPRRVILEIIGELETAAGILGADEQVSELQARAGELHFLFSGLKDEIANLNEKLVKQGVRVAGIREEGRGLEDIFLKLSSGETS